MHVESLMVAPACSSREDRAPALLTIEEARERFHLSRRYLVTAIRDGRLRAARFGRAIRLDVDDLYAFLEAAKDGAR